MRLPSLAHNLLRGRIGLSEGMMRVEILGGLIIVGMVRCDQSLVRLSEKLKGMKMVLTLL